MKIERSGDILTIKETPGVLWVLGIFFAAIGSVFVYGSLGGYSNYDEASRWVIAAHLFGGLCGIAAGYWIFYKAPMTRVTINRGNQTLNLKTRGLAGKSDITYRFDEIEQFCLIEEPDFDNDFVWSLALELADGEMIKLSAIQSTAENFKRDFVFQANEFMHRELPSYRDALDLQP